MKLSKQGGTVIVRGEAQGLTPGFHGFHVHWDAGARVACGVVD